MNELHTYRCSQCKTLAKTTVKTSHPPIKCVLCLRIMGFLFSSEIDQEEWQARNKQPVEYHSPHEVAERRATERKCDTCRMWCKPDRMIELQGVGRFCSEDCAQAGVLDHRAFMERIQKLREDMPWLYTAQKETA